MLRTSEKPLTPPSPTPPQYRPQCDSVHGPMAGFPWDQPVDPTQARQLRPGLIPSCPHQRLSHPAQQAAGVSPNTPPRHLLLWGRTEQGQRVPALLERERGGFLLANSGKRDWPPLTMRGDARRLCWEDGAPGTSAPLPGPPASLQKHKTSGGGPQPATRPRSPRHLKNLPLAPNDFTNGTNAVGARGGGGTALS